MGLGHGLLIGFLRDDLQLTGTKDGCNGAGHCGTCTVLVDGAPRLACRLLLADLAGARVLTIEGLAPSESALHPLQQSFVDHHAVQCGFCTPGMILAAKQLLDSHSASDPGRCSEGAGRQPVPVYGISEDL